MKWWNDGKTNKRSNEKPGSAFREGRLTFKRKSPSLETKSKISESNKGNIPWNKGKSNIISEETRQKMSQAAKCRIDRCGIPSGSFSSGCRPWNYGCTANENLSIQKYIEKQKNQKRTGEYKRGKHHPRYDENVHRREYIDYRNEVWLLTEKTYAKHKDTINPNGFPRTIAGVEGGYQLDHIISVYKGFISNTSPSEIANVTNLQMLPWKVNLTKGCK